LATVMVSLMVSPMPPTTTAPSCKAPSGAIENVFVMLDLRPVHHDSGYCLVGCFHDLYGSILPIEGRSGRRWIEDRTGQGEGGGRECRC
jgi:hypothetical protein